MGIEDARIRDRRRKSWFSCDNEIVDDYGLGIYGIGVYCVLSRYANSETEEASVSLTVLCKKLKIGRTKLLSILDALKDAGLISIEHGDRKHNNVYTLLEVPKRGGLQQDYPQSSSGLEGSPRQDPNKTRAQNYSSKGNEHDLDYFFFKKYEDDGG